MQKPAAPRYSLTSPHEWFDPVCRAEPIDPAIIKASRDGEQPSKRPTSGSCPMCGCPSFGRH